MTVSLATIGAPHGSLFDGKVINAQKFGFFIDGGVVTYTKTLVKKCGCDRAHFFLLNKVVSFLLNRCSKVPNITIAEILM